MKRKLWIAAAVMALAVLFCCTAATAEGSGTTYALKIAGTQVTDANMGDILGDGVFSFDGSKTLTVRGSYDNANTGTLIQNTGISGLTVRFADGLTLRCGGSLLECFADTKLTGGSVSFSCSNREYGIFVYDGSTLTISFMHLTIDAGRSHGNGAIQGSYGNEKLVVQGAEIDVTSGSQEEAVGGFGGGITLTGCAISTPENGTIQSGSIVAADGGSNTHVVTASSVASGQCGENVSWFLDSETGVLTISGTGAMEDYESTSPFGDMWESIYTVVIEDGITAIGEHAFDRCWRLKTVDIANSVAEIRYFAFDRTGLTEIVLPDSVTTLGRYAFANNSSLTRVVLSSGLTKIPFSCFASCSLLTDITIPDGVTYIDTDAFINCSSLTRMTLPASVSHLGDEVFQGCSSLSSVTVCNPEATFGANLFKDASENLVIHGPSGSTAEDYAFANSISFEAIDAPVNSSGSCGDHLIWSFDSATGTVTITGTGPMWDYSWDDYSNQSPFDATQTITSAVIGEGVTSIGAWFFDDCHNLTSISLPSTLQRIEEGAFYDNDLAELTIPDGVTYIGKWAFTYNQSFTSLTLPNSVTELGVAPFSYCTGLINVTLSEGLTEIPEAAFAQCSAMTDITIPDSVTSILAEAFDGCDSLTTIHGVPGSYAETFANAYGYAFVSSAATTASGTCGDGVNWTLYDGGKMIISGSGSMDSYSSSSHAPWYDNRSSVTSVTIRDGVTSIEAYAFSDCVYLTDVSIPDSVTSIGAYAFSCCVNLTDVSIPGGVKNVGECAFNGCTSLTNVSISSFTATFGSDVFAGCPAGLTLHGYEGSTTEAYAIANGIDFDGWPSSESGSCGDSVSWTMNHLTNTLTISGTGAIEDYVSDDPGWYDMRDSIYTVVIEGGITTIGKYAFYKMSAISSVTIPNSVTEIKTGAFDYCSGLTHVTIPDSVTAIGIYAFSDCNSLTSATILNPTATMGDDYYNVFENCASDFTLYGYYNSTASDYATNTKNPCAFSLLAPAPDFFLPAALTTIESEVFSGIAAQAAVIPKTVTAITGNPFDGGMVNTVYGYPGTAAQIYANTYSKTFVPLSDEYLSKLQP